MSDREQCQHLLHYLSDYIDDQLEDEALCQQITQHLENCQDCQVVIDTLQQTIRLYRTTASETQLPSSVRSRLLRRLDLAEFTADQD